MVKKILPEVRGFWSYAKWFFAGQAEDYLFRQVVGRRP